MNSLIDGTRFNVFAKLAAALFLVAGIFCSAYAAEQISATARSGEAGLMCHHCSQWRVDANGKVWPVTLQYITRPKNGTVTTQVGSGSRSVNGQVKEVRLTQTIYRSRKGFVGEDTFTYRRITADPTDPFNGKEYTVAVTVR